MNRSIGLLRYHTRARALAVVFWQQFADKKHKALLAAKMQGFGAVTDLFPDTSVQAEYVAELRELIGEFISREGVFPASLLDESAEYLFHELTGGDEFTVSRQAARLLGDFNAHLKRTNFAQSFATSIKAVQRDPGSCFLLLRDWVQAFAAERNGAATPEDGAQAADSREYVDEVAALLLRGKFDPKDVVAADVVRDLDGMLGSHPLIQGGKYRLNYNHLMFKLAQYTKQTVPRYNQYVALKKELVETARERMKLEEFRPRVLTSFVRNRLIDTVYLPMVGDNLAKQIGAAGEGKRTDRMGLLLLVSPPGYGKTTLMEYIANRLGIIFMKINGPAIGHEVTSLDPSAAPNAAAREEVQKLNLALEMGDNVMIYLDDIQHCSPEFLQKFISLCDATRKIEGVYKGRTRTYDLRGRKVCVVMAGNPYTESGEKFKIPDMLSNRADIYNLGEIIGENADAFVMSYLENCLIANPVLSKLASRSQKDVYSVIKLAEHGDQGGIELEGNYSVEELNELVATMKKLMRVRDVILTVNREYIRSAGQSDDYRTEPSFKLQGSYRNMNRIAEKVVPIMNDDELQALIVSNYENDAQTLTQDAEANLLKFEELMGIPTDAEARRWADIKRTFQRNVRLRGVDEGDKVGQVIVQLSSFSDGLDAIKQAMSEGVARLSEQDGQTERVEQHVDELVGQLRGLGEGLGNIRQALSSGMEQMAEITHRAAAETPTVAPPPVPTADMFKEVVAELKAQAVIAQPVAAEKQEITVVNKIPPSLLRVLQQQFKLMEGWMKPILETTTAQSAEIQELKLLLERSLSDYSQLIEGVEKARKRSKRNG